MNKIQWNRWSSRLLTFRRILIHPSRILSLIHTALGPFHIMCRFAHNYGRKLVNSGLDLDIYAYRGVYVPLAQNIYDACL